MILMLDNISPSSPYYDKPIIAYQSVINIDSLLDNGIPASASVRAIWSPDTYTGHQFVGTNNFSLNVTASFISTVDYIGIVGHNFYEGGVSFSLVYTPLGSEVAQTIFTHSSLNTHDGDSILVCFPSVTGSNFILQMSTTNGNKPKISHIKLGLRTVLEMPTWVDDSPLVMTRNVESVNQVSESGQFLGRINKSVSKSCRIEQSYNSEAFIYYYLKQFIAHCDGTHSNNKMSPTTFFYAPRPHRATPINTSQKDLIYGWAKNQIKPVQQLNNMYSWSVDVEAVA